MYCHNGYISWLKIIVIKLFILKNCAFNIDTESPILITNHFNHNQSHFGASVVLVRNDNQVEFESKSPTGWILIGAPKANSTHPNHTNINEPGVIWRCSLGRNETKKNDCRQLWMNPTSDDFDPKNPLYAHKDWKSGGWLGGSMFIGDSDRFVTCASRWVNRKFTISENEPHYFMNGMCYWVPKSTVATEQANDTWPWLISTPDYSYRLFPLVNRTRKNTNIGGYTSHDWIYGQAGFSFHLTKKNELILGAPGIFNWTGAVIQLMDSSSPSPEYKRFNSGGQPEFSEVWVSESIQSGGGEPFEYFGYAVTSGHFFDRPDGRTQYVGSAPRAEFLLGKVYIFSLRKTNSSSKDVAIDLLVEPLQGDRNSFYASYFGAVLCAVDVNNDQFDEIIVGAPLYSIRDDPSNIMFQDSDNVNADQDEGFDSDTKNNLFDFEERIVGDEGCVIVYSSDGQKFKVEQRQIICGDKIPGSRFGSAISAVGDLNEDNFKDVAIGAPYENGRGAVYIYHGSPILLVLTQKLVPQEIHDNIRGFGYSISYGVDIDKNNYPDLAVGCYQSNQVVIYRTIPLVNMKGQVSTTVRELWADQNEFNVTSCVSFEGTSLPSMLNFQVTLVLDNTVRQRRLVDWTKINTESSFKSLTFQKNNLTYVASFENSKTCFNLTVRRIPDIFEGSNAPIPLKIEQEVRLENYTTPVGKPKLIHYEINHKNHGEPSVTFHGSGDFEDLKKRQPLEMTKEREVSEALLPFSNLCKEGQEKEYTCIANLSLSVIFYNLSGIIYKSNDMENPYILGSSEKLIMEIKLRNDGQIANLPLYIRIAWNHNLIVNAGSSAESECKKITNLNQNKHRSENLVECNIRRPLKTTKTVKVELEFNVKDQFVGQIDSEMSFNLFANTSSNLVAEANSNFYLSTDYKTELLLHYSKEPKEVPFVISNLTARTIDVQQKFGLKLKGPSSVFSIQLEFRLPTKIEIDGKVRTLTDNWLVEGLNDNSIIPCQVYDDEESAWTSFEEWRLTTEKLFTKNHNIKVKSQDNNSTSSQLLDSLKDINLLGIFKKRKVNQQISINCSMAKVKCKLVKCALMKYFRPKDYASFLLQFRFFTQTTELFEDVEGLAIQSYVRATVLSETKELVGTLEKYGRCTSFLRIPLTVEIPIWIIIVAVVIGLLLLSLIIFLFTKCGFFKRTKRESIEILRKQYKASERFSVDVDGRFYDENNQRDMRFD